MAEEVILVPVEVQACLLNEDNWMHEVSSNSIRPSQLNGLFYLSEMLLGETDMGKVIDYIKLAPDGFFLYLTHAYSRNDTRHSYYNLKFVLTLIYFLLKISIDYSFRVVNYEQCGREYFTISNSGVSYYRPGEEVEFTPLENFAKEYYRYTRLIQVKYLH